MQMIDLMKRLAELDAKNSNVVKEGASQLVPGKFYVVGQGDRAVAGPFDDDGEAEYEKAEYSQGGQEDAAVAQWTNNGWNFDYMMEQGAEESDDNLVGMVQSTIEDILSGAQQGHDMTDNIADELGDHFDAVQNSGDENLQQAYSMVRDAADTSPEEQAQAAQSALEMLSGGKDVEEGVWDKVKDFGQAVGYLGGELKRTLTTPSGSSTGQKFGKGQVTPGGPMGPIARYQNRNKNEGVSESLEECGMMGSGMSQPHSPATINMTADSGAELTGMLKDIMSLAGLKQVTPHDLGHEHDPAVISAEPGISVAKVDSEPLDMKSMLAKIDSMNDTGDEKPVEEWNNTPVDATDVPEMDKDAMLNKGMHNQDPAGTPGAGDGRHLKNNPIATPEETYESLMAEYKKFISEN